MRAYCPGEATRRNERTNGQKTRSTSRRAGAQEAVVYLWCRENPLYLAANQPLNNHKNDHAAAIHAAAARDDCMDGAALLPDCTGTKEEYFYKESKTMKAKKLLSLLLVVAMLMSVLCMSVSASGSYDAISIGEGEPVKISWSGTTGTVISVNDSTFIPKQFLLWARNEYTIKVDGTALTALDAGDNDSAYLVSTKTTPIEITAELNNAVAYTVTCARYTETSGTNQFPADVCGYLPVGQFARTNSFGWGNLYSDNTNVKSSSNSVKFLNGYTSIGVSLGMAGGYVQFDMGNNPIQNDPNNKYGIDFIVYGNAFVGNPEAAGVMVSNDGVNWYTLAGSRHYMNGTKWNQKISYVRINSADQQALNSAFTANGIYYSTNYTSPAEQTQDAIDAAITAATWQGIPAASSSAAANLSWWPEYTNDASNKAENYGNVWKVGTDTHIGAVSNTANTAGVNWDKADKATATPTGAEVITYSGITTVQDDMQVVGTSATQPEMTDVYQWGYADVRVNGSQYGTVVNNPYADAPSTDAGAGGDGFDLSWAVKADGTPISISSARYIRVYSAVLYNAGIFGETSSEVCGLYVATSTTTDGVATPATLSFKKSTYSPVAVNGSQTQGITTITQPAGSSRTYTVNASGRVFVNGVTMESNQLPITLGSGESKLVQIVTQTNDGAAYINVVRFVAD